VKVWVDAQLSPALGPWLADRFQIDASPVRDLGLREARDRKIFLAAREADALILTKDADFVQLLETHGPPPCILWLTSGNTSTARVREVLATNWTRILEWLAAGEALIELRNRD
jgi:predicted nuclease of predicted toxin-antitoxin system